MGVVIHYSRMRLAWGFGKSELLEHVYSADIQAVSYFKSLCTVCIFNSFVLLLLLFFSSSPYCCCSLFVCLFVSTSPFGCQERLKFTMHTRHSSKVINSTLV